MTYFIDFWKDSRESADQNDGTALLKGKFVQIRKGNEDYFVGSPKKLCKFHSDIVVLFGKTQGIETYKVPGNGPVEFVDSKWKVIGGGKIQIDEETKHVLLSDSSQAYGSFERKGIVRKLSSADRFPGYTFEVTD